MICISAAAACALLLSALLPAAAEAISSPYENAIPEFGQRQLNDTLARRRLQQAQERQTSGRQRGAPEVLSPRSRAVCLNKRAVAAKLTSAKGRQLYALCAHAGY